MKLEKVRATQQHIEEFKRQQAEWRRIEQEKMEAENRRIMEFAKQQERTEENRMAKIREQEEAKEHLHKLVKKKFFLMLIILSVSSMTSLYLTLEIIPLFSSRCLRRL